MRSARSQGNVIRLVDSQEGEGEREGRMFEFIAPGEEGDDVDRGPPRNVV